MDKKNNKKGAGVLVLLVAILAVIIGLFNISRLTFLPESIRESVSAFIGTYFSKSVLSGISFETVVAALLAIVATLAVAGIVKFVVNNIKYKKTLGAPHILQCTSEHEESEHIEEQMRKASVHEHMSKRLPPVEERRGRIEQGKLLIHEVPVKGGHDHHKYVYDDDVLNRCRDIAHESTSLI